MPAQRKAITEPELKRKVREWLDSIGAWYYMIVPGGYSRRGVPDFICLKSGVFFAIETKTTGKKPTLLQEKEIEAMNREGCIAVVIDTEEQLEQFKLSINKIVHEKRCKHD